MLPGSRFLRKVDRRQAPIGGIVATTVIAWLGLLLGLEATAIGSLITFGTAAIYCAFLLTAIAALYARSQGVLSRARTRVVLNVLAVAWLAFETVNVAWPRASLAPLGRALVPGLGGADGGRRDRASPGSPTSFAAKPTHGR